MRFYENQDDNSWHTNVWVTCCVKSRELGRVKDGTKNVYISSFARLLLRGLSQSPDCWWKCCIAVLFLHVFMSAGSHSVQVRGNTTQLVSSGPVEEKSHKGIKRPDTNLQLWSGLKMNRFRSILTLFTRCCQLVKFNSF